MALFESGNSTQTFLELLRNHAWGSRTVRVYEADPSRYGDDLSPIGIYVWPYSSSLTPKSLRQTTYAIELVVVRGDFGESPYAIAEDMLTQISDLMAGNLYLPSSIDFDESEEGRDTLNYRAYFVQGRRN